MKSKKVHDYLEEKNWVAQNNLVSALHLPLIKRLAGTSITTLPGDGLSINTSPTMEIKTLQPGHLAFIWHVIMEKPGSKLYWERFLPVFVVCGRVWWCFSPCVCARVLYFCLLLKQLMTDELYRFQKVIIGWRSTTDNVWSHTDSRWLPQPTHLKRKPRKTAWIQPIFEKCWQNNWYGHSQDRSPSSILRSNR